MSAIPQWRLVGDWFDICSCDIPCPCEFAQPPTNNVCIGLLAWHVRSGQYGETSLDGLNVLAIGTFEGNIWAGASAQMGFYFDERADARQREALESIFGGRAGGWPEGFAKLVGDMRGFEYVPIAFEARGRSRVVADGNSRTRRRARRSLERTDDPARQEGSAHQSAGLGGRPGASGDLGPLGRSPRRRVRHELDGRKPFQQAHPVRLVGPRVRLSRPARVAGPVAGGAEGADAAPASVLRRARLSLLVALLLLAAATWTLTLYHGLMMEAPGAAATSDGAAAHAMPGMAMGGMPGAAWSAGAAAFFLASWVVMMAAMMLPAAAPMIVLFDAARQRREGRAALSTWIFVSGYLLVWLAAGVPAYAAIETANAIGASWTARRRTSIGVPSSSARSFSRRGSISSPR